MADRIQCWDLLNCQEKSCPVYVTKESHCWLVSGTHCREQTQGRFLEKMELCLECPVFLQGLDVDALPPTLSLINRQFQEMTGVVRERDRELEETNLDLAIGLSQSFEMVRKLYLGDPGTRLKMNTHNPLLLKLESELNRLAGGLEEMVEEAHEMAIGLCQHYDTLNRIAAGDFSAKASEQSANELISKLGALINKEADTLTGLIAEYRKTKDELQEKEERYRLLFEQSPLGVFHYDPRLKLTECNDRFIHLLQSSRERLIDLDLTALKDRGVLPAIQDALEGETGHYEGIYAATTSEAQVWVSMHTAPLFDRDGQVKGGVGIVEDITERKKAEETLRESENRYRTIFENTGAATIIINEDTTIELANAEFERLSGYPKAHLEKIMSWKSLVSEEDLDRLFQYHNLRRKEAAGVPSAYEFRLIDRQGQEKIVHNRVALIPGTGKSVSSMVDISERKRTEEALAAEKERLAVTLRSIGDGVITTDTEGRVVLLNQVAENQTGWSQEEAQGKPLAEVFCIVEGRNRKRCQSPVERVIESGRVENLEDWTVLIRRDGQERIIADSGAPIRDLAGKIIGVVLVFRDITEQHRISEELLKYEKLKSIGVLAGGIAHDFNNILTGIMGNISLAKMMARDPDKVVRRLDEAEKASYLAKELTHQLLTFSRGGAPVKTTAAITECIRDSVTFALRGSRLKSEFLIPPDIGSVDFDQGQIQQVVNNLAINAEQAMPQGGILKVEFQNQRLTADDGVPLPPGDYVRIRFIDQGSGISPEDLPKIFDPFFTTREKASGLGLATAYSIIKRHDGLITAESELGRGTTFIVWLPTSAKKETLPDNRPPTVLPGQGRILIMDDEALIRDILGEMLKRLGYSVEFAVDGAEAVKIYQVAQKIDQPFDLVIMDLTVAGGMGGKEALQKLLVIDPQIKALASSGYSSDPVMSNYQAYGFQGVIAKPYTMEELSRVVGRLLGG
ncbi:MAG: PAS domain S-box protein [Deltaproteobacteria bacterium]|nr:PAS domain S-box protein [Deltaproteobacteria bacterium]